MHKGNNLTVQFSRRNFGNTLKKKSTDFLLKKNRILISHEKKI